MTIFSRAEAALALELHDNRKPKPKPRRKNRGLCCEPYCRNLRRKDRKRCYKHDMQRWRAANRMKAAFYNLKDHARARGIEFTLSFEEFERFAIASNYVNEKGNGGHCITVDRIDNLKGYIPGNIQPLSRVENVMKRAKQDAVRMERGYAWRKKG